MRHVCIASSIIIVLAVAPALAQTTGTSPVTGARPGNIPGTNNSLPLGDKASNIGPSDTSSSIAPHLPDPAIDDDAGPRQFLMAARRAIAGRRTGEAQQALEMAETRALDRSVIPSAAQHPDQSPLVAQISQALDALGHRDWSGANRLIDQALAMTGGRRPARAR